MWKKIVTVIISFTLLLLIIFLILFKDRAIIVPDIKNEAIRTLDNKVYFSFNNYSGNESRIATTDFSFEKKSDTVFFECYIDKNKYFNDIQTISFKSGDGFSGIIIEIMKINNFYRAHINQYSDNPKILKNSGYRILRKNLILDKSNYKLGDSIFGKFQLTVEKLNQGKNVNVYNINSVFRSKVQ